MLDHAVIVMVIQTRAQRPPPSSQLAVWESCGFLVTALMKCLTQRQYLLPSTDFMNISFVNEQLLLLFEIIIIYLSKATPIITL